MTCKDSLLVSTTKAIKSLIEAELCQSDMDLAVTDFLLDWDFDGRDKDIAPREDRPHVRVIVPRRWEQIDRFDQSGLRYVGAFDIDVRKKLGPLSQEPKTCLAELDEMSRLTRLVEQLHALFYTRSVRLYPAGQQYAAEWTAGKAEVPGQSQILVAYSMKLLREQRLFYGCCREIFELTRTYDRPEPEEED
jgi:hypothetical protein